MIAATEKRGREQRRTWKGCSAGAVHRTSDGTRSRHLGFASIGSSACVLARGPSMGMGLQAPAGRFQAVPTPAGRADPQLDRRRGDMNVANRVRIGSFRSMNRDSGCIWVPVRNVYGLRLPGNHSEHVDSKLRNLGDHTSGAPDRIGVSTPYPNSMRDGLWRGTWTRWRARRKSLTSPLSRSIISVTSHR